MKMCQVGSRPVKGDTFNSGGLTVKPGATKEKIRNKERKREREREGEKERKRESGALFVHSEFK